MAVAKAGDAAPLIQTARKPSIFQAVYLLHQMQSTVKGANTLLEDSLGWRDAML